MRRYWTLFDNQWTRVEEHAGGGWDYPRRFSPEFMTQVRAIMDEALATARTVAEYRRVKMQDDNLRQFELWMKLVRDLNEGRLANLGLDSNRWLGGQIHLANAYAEQFGFSRAWAPDTTVAGRWFKMFFQPAYLDATRIARNFALVTPRPLRQWKYLADPEKNGDGQGLYGVSVADGDWKTTDIGVDTWSALGIPNYYGPVWYRQNVRLGALPAGARTYLWISREDGDIRAWVNGQAVPYLDDSGAPQESFRNGYGKPLSFDITAAVKAGADNQITIKATRVFINELGVGGLLGPVYLYRDIQPVAKTTTSSDAPR